MHSNNTNNLINLKGVKIKSIQHLDKTILIHIETKATAQTCPHCGNSTTRIHDYRIQKIKHFPILHKSVFLYLRKRRYTCSCGKHFYEAYSFLPKYMRMSTDLVKFIIHECRNQISFTTVANQTHVSSPTVIRLFDKVKYPKPSTLPEVLCIDEFRGNAGGEKFQCIIIDGKKRKILDILPKRSSSFLIQYFASFPKHQRLKVKFFVSDMWEPYIELARCYFPNATIIVDKYHFIRQVTWGIESIRKRLQKTMTPTLRKYYKRSRTLILKRYNHIYGDSKRELELMLTYNDDLRRAHWLKERFYEICQEPKYSVQRQDFWAWVKVAENSNLKEFQKCAATYRRWKKEILNAFKYGYTNGPIEGFNNKIKVIKRIAYGMQNFERFRNRILHCN